MDFYPGDSMKFAKQLRALGCRGKRTQMYSLIRQSRRRENPRVASNYDREGINLKRVYRFTSSRKTASCHVIKLS